MKQSNFICISGIISRIFFGITLKKQTGLFLEKPYKISKVSFTNIDVGGILILILGKAFLLTILQLTLQD